ncbi:MAG: acyltransferase family protein [Oscillospiraceae bacterium]|jgi:fucose 4-O-acetylase-like acetyltransferase|nr:acyltransferase family protein [Oscillospiraceae bacterium]
MEQPVQKQRLWYWDNAKALLIFLVVLGHLISPVDTELTRTVYTFIYIFHMPLFIFIAGYFGRKAQTAFQFQRVVGFLALAVAVKLLKFVTTFIMGETYGLHPFAGADEPWYLMAMAMWLSCSFLLGSIKPQPKLWAVLVVMILLGMLVGYETSDLDGLALMRVIVCFPFYYAGMAMPRDWMGKLRQKRWRWVALVVFCGLIVLVAWQREFFLPLRPLFTNRNRYSSIGDIFSWGWLYRLGHYVLAGALGLGVLLLAAKRRLPLVTHVGSHTLQVFFWQSVLMPFMRVEFRGAPTTLSERLYEAVPFPVVVLAAAAMTLLFSTKPFSFPVKWLSNLPLPRFLFSHEEEPACGAS